MDNAPPPRPLAPAPSAIRPPTPNSLSSRQSEKLKREHAATACLGCKARKQKCRGGQPCEACVRSGKECIVDQDNDMRRKAAVKRKLEKLEENRDLFALMVQTLRRSDSPEAVQLLRLIQSGAPVQKVKTFLNDRLDRLHLEKSPELKELQSHLDEYDDATRSPRRRRSVMDIRRIVDEPPFKVPAKPWTTVTDDDNIVSHLISLWLTWSHPFVNCLDRGLFVRDMQAGELDCEFCSPFLVNTILAEASFYSDYPEVYTAAGEMTSRGFHFYREAKRLLDKEEGRITIPTLQGLAHFMVYTVLIGKDRLGWMYTATAAHAAEEYAGKLPRTTSAEKGPISERDEAVNNTLWGIFNLAMTTGFANMKAISFKPPKRPWLAADHPGHDIWSLYPGSRDPVAAHTACVFNSYCQMTCIYREICHQILDIEQRPPDSQLEALVNKFYERLREWHEKLPHCIQLDDDSIPHVLSLHMCYHTSVLQLYGCLKNLVAEGDHSSESTSHARKMCLSSAREISSLITVHRSKWGIDRMSATAIHWVSTSLFVLLEDLDNPENCGPFIDLCTVARAFSRRWTLSKGILRMVQITASQMGATLPEEVKALFLDFESECWEGSGLYSFSSGYPNFATILKPGSAVEDSEMDQFLKRWDRLHIE